MTDADLLDDLARGPLSSKLNRAIALGALQRRVVSVREKIRSRLMTIREERESIMQNLDQTDAQLELARDTITTYLRLLDDPARVYRDSEDQIRRALLLAFYTRLDVDRGRIDGTTEPVRDLQDAAVGYERAKRNRIDGSSATTADHTSETRKSPSRSAKAPTIATKIGLLAADPGVDRSIKSIIVGLTGFEPATP